MIASPTRLSTRIALLFLLLILLIQLLSFALIRTAISRQAVASVNRELDNGTQVLEQLLMEKADELRTASRLLAADYGFRTALLSAERDRPTLDSALENQTVRIEASIARLFDLQGDEIASTGASVPGLDAPLFAGLIAQAGTGGDATATYIAGNRLYLLVASAVRAPLPVAWVVMGFAVDEAIGQDLLRLTDLHLTLLEQTGSGTLRMAFSTLPAQKAELLRQTSWPSDLMAIRRSTLGSEDFGTRVIDIGQSEGQRRYAVLQRSIAEAEAPYRQLQLLLLGLTVIGLLAALVGSLLTARHITRPLGELVRAARRLQAGEHVEPVAITRLDEIGKLAAAFNAMSAALEERQQQITRLAYWDSLSGLPNRVLFEQQLQARLEAGETGYVLILDLVRFKLINDVLGHALGNALIRAAGDRLANPRIAAAALLARLGGDEFALWLPGVDGDRLKGLQADVMARFQEPFSVEDQAVDLSIRIGAIDSAQYPGDAALLLGRAEMALYAAKTRQEDSVLYTPLLDQSSEASLSLMSDLRRAAEQNEFVLNFQPKMDLARQAVSGAEVLVRWQHPERGRIPPDAFIPFAEQTGFIRTLSRWVIEATLQQQVQWRKAGYRLPVAVNLSARDLMDADLPAWLTERMAAHELSHDALTLEITESAIMDDPQRAQFTLEQLDALGFRLSIDDFGTGYSSLGYLKRLPVRELKIDKSFVLRLNSDSDDRSIVRATVELAHSMGLKVVAEGVENREIWDSLLELGCDYGQGYYMSRPLPAAEFMTWLEGVRRNGPHPPQGTPPR
jgi:diguanylate cyclase (GGDEF)-like protein